MLIDTHCHLDFPQFDPDREEVIRRSRAGGIACLIDVGSTLKNSAAAVGLAQKHDFIYAAVGIHPHDAASLDENAHAALKELAGKKKVVAIGETGLDYFKNYSPRESQRRAFISLIRLAKESGLPLIIHSRQAQDDTLDILRDFLPLKAVVHCFSGDEKFLEDCLGLGFFISFTCNITYKKAQALRALVRAAPLERVFLESDAPYLPPEGLRGKRNEPLQVKAAAEAIAGIKGISAAGVGDITSANARRFFFDEAQSKHR